MIKLTINDDVAEITMGHATFEELTDEILLGLELMLERVSEEPSVSINDKRESYEFVINRLIAEWHEMRENKETNND